MTNSNQFLWFLVSKDQTQQTIQTTPKAACSSLEQTGPQVSNEQHGCPGKNTWLVGEESDVQLSQSSRNSSKESPWPVSHLLECVCKKCIRNTRHTCRVLWVTVLCTGFPALPHPRPFRRCPAASLCSYFWTQWKGWCSAYSLRTFQGTCDFSYG